MRSRIDYPTSGDDESDNNNHVMVSEDAQGNSRRNRVQFLNLDRRPTIEQYFARVRSMASDFPIFNGVQNLFINLRPNWDESSSSENLGEENIN